MRSTSPRVPAAVLALLIWLCGAWPAGAESVTVVRSNGNSANRVDLVILGDGYTADQIASGKYATDVETFLVGMFNQQPFAEYRTYFNVYRIDVTSNESGADHPENNTYVDTALGAAYNCSGIQRLICVDNTAVNAVLTRSIPAANARDLVVVLVNDPVYGGSGGSIAVASLHPLVVELVLHETGHSFGLLTDEYGGPPPPSCYPNTEPAAPNATRQTSRDLIKWSAWIDAATPIPTTSTAAGVPGLYEGAAYCDTGLFRPTYNSKMRSLGTSYDQINTEQLIKRFYNLVSPVDDFSPAASSVSFGTSQNFTVTMPQPATHALVASWTLDGVVAGSGSHYELAASSLSFGSAHTLRVTVTDTTAWVRNDPAGVLAASHSWSVSRPTLAISLSGNLAFGNVRVNTTKTSTLSIGNVGNQTLTVDSISYPAGFSGAWSGSIGAGGSQSVTVTFAPAAVASYGGIVTVNANQASGSNTLAISGAGVTRLTPTITWANPAAIPYGTALGATQLNATVDVPGTLVYSPSAGTILRIGQTLSVTFTPTDTASYTTATKSVTIDVVPGAAPFTDPSPSVGVTAVRVVHVTELRTRINALRARYGLGTYSWTDPTLLAGQTPLRAVHITELRAALQQVYAAAGRTPPVYTDPVLTPGQTMMKAVHVMELRAAVVALE